MTLVESKKRQRRTRNCWSDIISWMCRESYQEQYWNKEQFDVEIKEAEMLLADFNEFFEWVERTISQDSEPVNMEPIRGQLWHCFEFRNKFEQDIENIVARLSELHDGTKRTKVAKEKLLQEILLFITKARANYSALQLGVTLLFSVLREAVSSPLHTELVELQSRLSTEDNSGTLDLIMPSLRDWLVKGKHE